MSYSSGSRNSRVRMPLADSGPTENRASVVASHPGPAENAPLDPKVISLNAFALCGNAYNAACTNPRGLSSFWVQEARSVRSKAALRRWSHR